MVMWNPLKTNCSCCSVTKLCSTLSNSVGCSRLGFPVLHYLPEFAQTHVHWVGDTIQPSNPLLPRSPPALNLSQWQGLFQWVGSSHQVVKLLELQHQSFQWISGLISFEIHWFDLLAVQGLSRIYSSTVVWKHQFFGIQPFLWSSSWLYLKSCIAWYVCMTVSTCKPPPTGTENCVPIWRPLLRNKAGS